jgi:signal transduction histidine kinase
MAPPAPGSARRARLADDGPGIPEELQHRIFEPFFTTKGNAGTGLGLSMVYSCVQRNSGRLTLDSAPGRGARFTLWFPSAAIAPRPDPS